MRSYGAILRHSYHNGRSHDDFAMQMECHQRESTPFERPSSALYSKDGVHQMLFYALTRGDVGWYFSFRLIIASTRSNRSKLSSENFRANNISPEPHSSSIQTISRDSKYLTCSSLSVAGCSPRDADQSA